MSDTERPAEGPIDFTLMYVTHDAFRRDLARLRLAAETGRTADPRVLAGWENFHRQLVVHHTVEDAALWPRLTAAVADRPDDLETVRQMEAEHALLDPLLALVGQALPEPDAELPDLVWRLLMALTSHMSHEEEQALPLIQKVLTPDDWNAFRRAMARKQGPSGAAAYVPWILDDASTEQRDRFLHAMPGPIGVVNRLLWEPRYRRRGFWGVAPS
jgi:iron-sulfur cluster repair protein YtfE (RIC family)